MIELPTKRRDVQNYNPKLLVIFGRPKSGICQSKIFLTKNMIDLLPCYQVIDNIITPEYPRKLSQEIDMPT